MWIQMARQIETLAIDRLDKPYRRANSEDVLAMTSAIIRFCGCRNDMAFRDQRRLRARRVVKFGSRETARPVSALVFPSGRHFRRGVGPSVVGYVGSVRSRQWRRFVVYVFATWP